MGPLNVISWNGNLGFEVAIDDDQTRKSKYQRKQVKCGSQVFSRGQ